MINEDEIERGWGIYWSKEEIEYLRSLVNEKSASCRNHSKEGFGCTRNKNHRGIHVAHGIENKVWAVWDNEEIT